MSLPLLPNPWSTPEAASGHKLKALVLIMSGVCTTSQGAAMVALHESDLLNALADPETIKIVQGEIVHLRLSGRLAALKAAVLTERLVDHLLAMDPADTNPTLVAKLAELGARLRPTNSETLTPRERRDLDREHYDHLRQLFLRGIRRRQAEKGAS